MKKTITLGENLKQIRKELRLRQHEITGGQITRNLISLIENNKTPLNKKTAKLLCENINKLAKERNVTVDLILEDLMVAGRFNAKKKAEQYIGELRDYKDNEDFHFNEDYLNEIEEFLQTWSIAEKSSEIYMILGDLYYLNGDRVTECIYLTKALENYFIKPIKEDAYVLIIKLIDNYIYRKKYNDAIRLSNLDNVNFDAMPDYYISKLNYNRAYAFHKLEQYDKALDSIQVSKKHLDRTKHSDMLRRVISLEGLCYDKKGLNNEAIDMYKEIVYTLGNNYSEVCLAYCNIIKVCMKQDMKDEVSKYISIVADILPKIESDNDNLLDIYTSVAKAHCFLSDYKSCEELYIKAYNTSIDRSHNEGKKEVALQLFNFYLKTGQTNKIFDNHSLFEEAVSVICLDNDLALLLNYLLINMEENNYDKIKNSIQKLLKNA